ncbi:MAG: hypothetical protein ACYC3L_16920 [Gemmatimonadaceae bacterium]
MRAIAGNLNDRWLQVSVDAKTRAEEVSTSHRQTIGARAREHGASVTNDDRVCFQRRPGIRITGEVCLEDLRMRTAQRFAIGIGSI